MQTYSISFGLLCQMWLFRSQFWILISLLHQLFTLLNTLWIIEYIMNNIIITNLTWLSYVYFFLWKKIVYFSYLKEIGFRILHPFPPTIYWLKPHILVDMKVTLNTDVITNELKTAILKKERKRFQRKSMAWKCQLSLFMNDQWTTNIFKL